MRLNNQPIQKYWLLIACSILFMATSLLSQNEHKTSETNQPFLKMRSEFHREFGHGNVGKEKLHWDRFENFYAPRLYPNNSFDDLFDITNKEASKMDRLNPSSNRSAHGNWQFKGPSALTTGANFGRCVRMRIHPTDPNTFYVLTSSGGLWKSTNAGGTWTNLTENLPYLFGIDFIINSDNPENIQIATSNLKAAGIISKAYEHTRGIFITENGGETWELRQVLYDPTRIFRLQSKPNSPNFVIAGTSTGIYYTTNNWKTKKTAFSSDSHTWDIEFKPGSPLNLYAVNTNGSDDGFWISNAGGGIGTWTKINDPVLNFMDTMHRADIAVSPANPDCIYLVASDNQVSFVARSLNSGVAGSWTIMTQTDPLWTTMAGYNMVVAIDPADIETIFIGAVGLFKSTMGGLAGTNIDVVGTHPDHHDFVFHNGNIYDLNDGGIGKSTNGGSSWTNITSGIEVNEAYTVAGSPQNISLIYTGAQDTGPSRIDAGGKFTSIYAACCGDATKIMIDYTNPFKVYMSPQTSGLRFTTDGWATFQESGPGGLNFEPEFGAGHFISPYEMDTGFPQYIYAGKDSVYRLDMSEYTSQYLGNPGAGKSRNLAHSPSDPNVLYCLHGGFGYDTEVKLYRTDEARTTLPIGASWTEKVNDIPVSTIMSDLAVHPLDADEIYVTHFGLEAGNKVFFSDNAGAPGSWENISGDLPNVTVNCITPHPNGLNHGIYIGTDIGVFYKDDNLTDWVYFSNNLPTVPVTDIYINPSSSEILIATYGRGVWKSDLLTTCLFSSTLSGGPTGGTQYHTTTDNIVSTATYSAENHTIIFYQTGDLIDLKAGFQFPSSGLFIAKIGPCPNTVD